MLAGLHGLDGPRHMQMVRQRVVDRLDGWVGKKLLVGAIDLRDAKPLSHVAAAGDIVNPQQRTALHGWDDLLGPDLGGTQNTPGDGTSHPSFTFHGSALPASARADARKLVTLRLRHGINRRAWAGAEAERTSSCLSGARQGRRQPSRLRRSHPTYLHRPER